MSERVYAESSAVLRWLLGASDAHHIQAILAEAAFVATSALTTAEVSRTLRRLVATGSLNTADRDRAWMRYRAAASHWGIHAVTDEILARVEDSFAFEPARTLDAIHLATAAELAMHLGALTVVSTDERLRRNATALGLGVGPSA